MKNKPVLSVIIPVYNERDTLWEIIERVKRVGIDKEIIVVDDGSTDGSRELLEGYSEDSLRLIVHKKNLGKGAAIISGLKAASGDVVVIQDGDLEQDPNDYHKLIRPILEGHADVVYGSRILNRNYSLNPYYIANRLFAFLANVLFDGELSDIMTGYKMGRLTILKSLKLCSKGFDIEPEITAKLLKKKVPIIEVPIFYSPRSYEEGKKIRFKDSILICWRLFRCFISIRSGEDG